MKIEICMSPEVHTFQTEWDEFQPDVSAWSKDGIVAFKIVIVPHGKARGHDQSTRLVGNHTTTVNVKCCLQYKNKTRKKTLTDSVYINGYSSNKHCGNTWTKISTLSQLTLGTVALRSFILTFGLPGKILPFSPTLWRCCLLPLFSSSLWKRTHSQFGQRIDIIFWLLNLFTPGFRFRKSSSPRFLPVGQALRGLLFWFVCIWFIFCYYYYIYYLLSQ
jgi:hypothetical protein